MSKNIKNELDETIRLTDSVRLRIESEYLIISNKKKCKQLLVLGKSDLGEEGIIDVLVSLHIILEVSLNTLFRHLLLMGIKKDVDEFEIIKNIDAINFIDKTVLFIYNSKFNFEEKLAEASRYHSIIGKLKNFAELRNKLLHGHSISFVFPEGESGQSLLKKKINPESLTDQIEKFKFILEGMRFYLDCLDSSLTQDGKERFKRAYLNDDFLLQR